MDGDQGPVHEVGEIRKLGAVLVASMTNLLDGVPFDLPGEHCQTGEQVALAGSQEPVGPVDDIRERAVALGCGPAALVQDLVGLLQRVDNPRKPMTGTRAAANSKASGRRSTRCAISATRARSSACDTQPGVVD